MPTKSKGKRKGKKGKKGKKKEKVVPEPLPLHILTDIYKNIDTLTRQLLDARVIARKKRKEAELLEKELEDLKRDDVVYREHLQNQLDDVKQSLLDFQNRIDKERESIDKEIIKVNAELDKKLKKTFALIEEGEKRLEELQKSLLELQPLRDLVAQTLEKLETLMIEYNRLRIEFLIKSTHLRNQYLIHRAELYNFLQEQLYFLISKIRSYLMPILWDHMQTLQQQNRCHRWELIQIDELNFKLLDKRNRLLKEVETLDGEQQYYGTEWVFERLNDMREKYKEEQLRWKMRLKEVFKHRNLTQHYKMHYTTTRERSPPKVVVDFREFLQKRLAAITEAKDRQEKLERHRELQRRNVEFKKQQMTAHKRKAMYQQLRTVVAAKKSSKILEGGSPSKHSEHSITKIGSRELKLRSSQEFESKDFEEHEGEDLAASSVMSVMSVRRPSESKQNIKESESLKDVSRQKRLSKEESKIIQVREEEEE